MALDVAPGVTPGVTPPARRKTRCETWSEGCGTATEKARSPNFPTAIWAFCGVSIRESTGERWVGWMPGPALSASPRFVVQQNYGRERTVWWRMLRTETSQGDLAEVRLGPAGSGR